MNDDEESLLSFVQTSILESSSNTMNLQSFIICITSIAVLDAKGSELELLLYDGSHLWIFKNGTHNYTMVSSNENIEGIDYWDNTIIWSDSKNFVIYQTDMMQNITTEVISEEMPCGIAVDWIGWNLYWVNYEQNVISVSNMKGQFRTILYWQGLNYPTHLSLDPTSGHLFYFEIDNNPKLVRASMSGDLETHVNILHHTPVPHPGGLALDIRDKKVYWTDSLLGRIENCDYDGSNRFLFVQGLVNPAILDAFDETVVWLEGSQIFSKKVDGEHTIKKIVVDKSIVNMKIYNIKRTKEIGFLHYDGEALWIYNTTTLDHTFVINSENIGSFDYYGYIIVWSDTNTNSIYKTNVITHTTTEVIGGEMTSGIAVDWIGQNLYWINKEQNVIALSKLTYQFKTPTHQFKTTLYWKGLKQPTQLCLDPTSGYMFYLDIDLDPVLTRASLAGEVHTQIIIYEFSAVNNPGALALDIKWKKIYWADSHLGRIESCNYDGSNSFFVVQGLLSPTDLDVFDEKVYWLERFQIYSFHVGIEAKEYVISNKQIMKMKVYVESKRRKDSSVSYPCDHNVCDHLCLLSSIEPFYKCICAAAHSSEGITCSRNELPTIIISQKNTDSLIISGNRTWQLTSGDIRDMAYMYSNESILYVAQKGSEVISLNIYETDIPTSVAMAPSPSYGLLITYDWIGRNIFFLDQYSRKISVTNLYEKALRTFPFFPPKIIKDTFMADSLNRYLFWNGIYSIERIGMDGNDITYFTIVEHDSHRYYFRQKPFTLDIKNKEIYEYYSYSLYVMDYDGKNSHVIMEGDSYNFVTISDKFLFYVNIWSNFIFACSKISGRNCKEIIKIKDISNVLIVHEDIYETADNWQYLDCSNTTRPPPQTGDVTACILKISNRSVCEDNNGGCSDLCLLSPLVPYYICVCYDGFELMKDNKTCDINECDISSGICLGGKCVNTIGSYTCICDFGYKLNILSETCEDIDECPLLHGICKEGRTCLNVPGTYECVLLDADLNDNDDEYDLLVYGYSNIFYVKVISTNYIKRTIYTNNVLLRGVDFDPVDKMIFFLGIRPGFMDGIIQKISLDNTGKMTIVERLAITDYGLVIDRTQHKMYWVKSDIGIVSAYLNGANQQVIVRVKDINFNTLTTLSNDWGRNVLKIDPLNNKYLYFRTLTGELFQIYLGNNTIHKTILKSKEKPMAISNGILYYVENRSIISLNIESQESRVIVDVHDIEIMDISLQGKYMLFMSANGNVWRKNGQSSHETYEHAFTFSNFQQLDLMYLKTIDITSISGGDICHLQYEKCIPLCTCLSLTSHNDSCLCSNGTLVDRRRSDMDVGLITKTDNLNNLYYANQMNYAFSQQNKHMVHYSYQQHTLFIQSNNMASLLKNESADWILYGNCYGSQKDWAFDWVGQNTYWINREQKTIEVSDEFNQYRASLYWGNIESPESIAIDSIIGFMFWSDVGSNPKIERAELDAYHLEGRVVIAANHLVAPYCLSLDFLNARLFWLDKILKSIESCRYDGSDRVIVLGQFISEPTVFAIYNNNLLWVDRWRLYVLVNPLEDYKTIFKYNEPKILDIKHMKSLQYPNDTMEHPCHKQPKPCSHLCLVSRIYPYYTCLCTAGYRLVNGSFCLQIELETTVVVATSNGIVTLKNNIIFNISGRRAKHIVYDRNEKVIMYQADGNSTLVGLTLNGNKTYNIITFDTPATRSFTYDWVGDNIYVLVGNGSIQVYNINKNGHKTFGYRTSGIQLHSDSYKRLLVIKEQHVVSTITMDGTRYTNIIQLGDYFYSHKGFALDTRDSMIYIVQETGLLRYDYDGKLHQHISGSGNIHCLFLSKDEMYFVHKTSADWLFNKSGGSIMSCDKYSGVNCNTIFPEFDVIEMIVLNGKDNLVREGCDNDSVSCDHLCLLSPSAPFYKCDCFDGYELLYDGKSCGKIPCVIDNDGCSQICTAYPDRRGSYCTCYDNFTLSRDMKTCLNSSMELYMFVLLGDYIQYFYIEQYDYFQYNLTDNEDKIFQLDGDPIKTQLYVSKKSRQSNITHIFQMDIQGHDLKSVTTIGSAEHFTLDWMERRIYWILDNYIFSFDLESGRKSVIIQIPGFSSEGIKLCVDTFNGILYWIDGRIMRTTTTGEDIRVVRSGNYTPKVLAIDNLYQKLYVEHIDAINGPVVVGINTDGSGLHYFINHPVDSFIIFDQRKRFVTEDVHFQISNKKIRVVSHRVDAMQIMAIDQNNEKTIPCPEYAKCASWTGGLICLDFSMICDGIIHCYDNHDEIYCPFISNTTEIEEIIFICYKIDLEDTMSYAGNQSYIYAFSNFLTWDNHPFSLLIELDTLFQSKCSLQFKLNTSNFPGQIMDLTVNNLHRIHKLRQIVFATKKLRFNFVQELIIKGENMLKHFTDITLSSYKELRRLQFQNTSIKTIPVDSFRYSMFLDEIRFKDNQLLSVLENKCFKGAVNLVSLTIIGSALISLHEGVFTGLENIRYLNLSDNMIDTIETHLFSPLVNLEILDISGNNIRFFGKLFDNNAMLRRLHCDSFHFCCFSSAHACFVPADNVISLCKYLVSSRWMFIIIWIFTVVSCILMILMVIFSCISKLEVSIEFAILLTTNAASDFLFVCYMAHILAMDRRFYEEYVWFDHNWRKSSLCLLMRSIVVISVESSILTSLFVTIKQLFEFADIKLSPAIFGSITSLVIWFYSYIIGIVVTIYHGESDSPLCIPEYLNFLSSTNNVSTFTFGLRISISFIVLFSQMYLIIAAKYRKDEKSKTPILKTENVILSLTASMTAVCMVLISVTGYLPLYDTHMSRDGNNLIFISVTFIRCIMDALVYLIISTSVV